MPTSPIGRFTNASLLVIGFVSTFFFLFSFKFLDDSTFLERLSFFFSPCFASDFGFNKQIYNVLEVNKTSYNTCDDTNYMTNVTRGGRDVFKLSEAKVYYFLCGRGFCSQGMKVEVPVHEIPPSPLPPPESLPSDADLQLSNGFSSYKFGFFRLIITSLVLLGLLF